MSTASKRGTERVEVNKHTTLILRNGKPFKVENDGFGEDPVEDAAQYIGHPLESEDQTQDKPGNWICRVWFNEMCECSNCAHE